MRIKGKKFKHLVVLKQNLKAFFFYNTWLEFVILTQALRNVLSDCALNYYKQVQSKGKGINKVQAD